MVNATTVLGWSIEEFWKSTPRMYYACFYTYVSLNVNASRQAVKQHALVGKEAIDALSGLAKYIR